MDIPPEERQSVVAGCLAGLGPHDAPVREFEMVDYTFEFVLDYGAYRELKRHRMMSYVPQPLTVNHGYAVPRLIADAGLESRFRDAVAPAEEAFHAIQPRYPQVSQYLATHAHNQRVLAKMNLRECFHLFKLRTSQLAHFAIQGAGGGGHAAGGGYPSGAVQAPGPTGLPRVVAFPAWRVARPGHCWRRAAKVARRIPNSLAWDRSSRVTRPAAVAP